MSHKPGATCWHDESTTMTSDRRASCQPKPINWHLIIRKWQEDFDDELDWIGEWRGRRG